jgi:hypothetical protein
MIASVACDALRSGKRLELRYDGWSRVVEVHTVGTFTSGKPGMSVYQVRGGSNSNESIGWKNMLFDETFAAHMINEKSEAPRDGYKRNASTFNHITCQI